MAPSSLAAAANPLAVGYLRVLRERFANCQQHRHLGSQEISQIEIESRCYAPPVETYVVVSKQDLLAKKEMT